MFGAYPQSQSSASAATAACASAAHSRGRGHGREKHQARTRPRLHCSRARSGLSVPLCRLKLTSRDQGGKSRPIGSKQFLNSWLAIALICGRCRDSFKWGLRTCQPMRLFDYCSVYTGGWGIDISFAISCVTHVSLILLLYYIIYSSVNLFAPPPAAQTHTARPSSTSSAETPFPSLRDSIPTRLYSCLN